MRINLFLNEEEHEYLKSKDKGYMRILLQDDMRSAHTDTVVRKKPAKKTPRPKADIPNNIFTKKGDGLHTCKTCGSQLMYYKGKCKLCSS
jgi:hypothetical protein